MNETLEFEREINFDSEIDDIGDTEGFVINSASLAEWAYTKIKEKEERRDIFIEAARAKIAYLELQIRKETEQCKKDTQFLRLKLRDYIYSVSAKDAKTQLSLKLPSGTVVVKKAYGKITHDESILIDKLKHTQYVSYPPKLAWGEYKKTLKISNNRAVIDKTTGEILTVGVGVEIVPEVVEVK